MKKIIMATLLLTSVTFADVFVPKLSKVKIKDVEVEISENCKAKNCMAYHSLDELNKKNFEKISSQIYGGKQPGFVVCRKLFKAEMKFYKDRDGNEYVYCLFKDKSYVATTQYDLLISYFE